MAVVRKASFKIVYNGKNITADITRFIVDVEYLDKEHGESDEFSFTVDDTDGNWRNSWYPTKGDTLEASIGYDDLLISAGKFVVDQVDLSGPPDQVSIRALAASVKKNSRSKVSYAHEKKTLKEIVQTVAKKMGLTVQGTIENIKIERITQNDETDLAFVKRLADEYGYLFAIKGDKLVFTSVFDIEKGKVVRVIDRLALSRYNISDKTVKTYKDAQVTYHNPAENKVVKHKVSASDSGDSSYAKVGAEDTLHIRTKAENKQQAEAKAKAALHKANSKQQEGSIEIEGDPLILAGNNFELTGMGELSGKFHVVSSRHRISKSGGYVTEAEIKRVGFVEVSKRKSKRKPKPKEYDVKVVQ